MDLDAGPGDFLYQDQVVLDFALTLDEDALEGLATDFQQEAEDVETTFTFDGQNWLAGLHLKGESSFRTIQRKAAFKIDFGQWQPGATFHGVRRLTLNNMVQDDSALSENLAYRLFALLDVPAPRHGYACLSVNGEDFGLYSVVETMDEQFLARTFDDPSGFLYEGGHGADFEERRAWNFAVQEQGPSSTPFQDVHTITEALDGASSADLLEVLGAFFRLDQLLGMWAVELVSGNIDSYLTRANNFLLYHEPASDRWTLMPWGVDQAFREPLDPFAPWDLDVPAEPGRMFEDCLASAPCLEALASALLRASETLESADLATIAAAETERIQALTLADPRAEGSNHQIRSAQRQVQRFLRRRPAQVRQAVEGL